MTWMVARICGAEEWSRAAVEPRSRARARAAEANTDMKTGIDGRSCRPALVGCTRLLAVAGRARRLYPCWRDSGHRLRVDWRGLANTILQGTCALKSGICDRSCRRSRGVRVGLLGGIVLGCRALRRCRVHVRHHHQLPPSTCLQVDCARKSGIACRVIQRRGHTCLLIGHRQVGRCACNRCVRALLRVVDRRDCGGGHRLQWSQHDQSGAAKLAGEPLGLHNEIFWQHCRIGLGRAIPLEAIAGRVVVGN